jgi:Tol biopolymer transport system component
LIFVFPIHQGTSGAWSPDGQKLIFRNDTTLYVANAYGTSSRKLADLPGPLGAGAVDSTSPAWSPDGQTIALNLYDAKTQLLYLWELSADGTNLHKMFPGWHTGTGDCCGSWTLDGKYAVFAVVTPLKSQGLGVLEPGRVGLRLWIDHYTTIEPLVEQGSPTLSDRISLFRFCECDRIATIGPRMRKVAHPS